MVVINKFKKIHTFVIPLLKAANARRPGPSTVRPSSLGPHEALYMSTLSTAYPRECQHYAFMFA